MSQEDSPFFPSFFPQRQKKKPLRMATTLVVKPTGQSGRMCTHESQEYAQSYVVQIPHMTQIPFWASMETTKSTE